MAHHLTGPRPSTPTPANIDGVATPPTNVHNSATTSEQLANEFNHSPLPWDAHFPSGTAATTTTTTASTAITTATTSTTVVTTTANTTTSSSESSLHSPAVMPEWQKNLPEGFLRGDECFRERYGAGGSLMDDNGDLFQGFPLDEARCHPRLQWAAHSLGASMETRNGVVMDVRVARAALADAETALQDEKTRFELTQAAAQRNGQPLSEAPFKTHEEALAALSKRRDDAKNFLAIEEQVLTNVQGSLETRHAEAETLTKLSDEVLTRALKAVAQNEPHGALFHPVFGGTLGGLGFAAFRQVYFNISLEVARMGFDGSPEMQAYALEREDLAHDFTRFARDVASAFLVVAALVVALKRLQRL